MIRLRIDRSSTDDFQGLVWAEREGRRTLMYPVVIEQTEPMGQYDTFVPDWEPVEVVEDTPLQYKGVDVSFDEASPDKVCLADGRDES